MNMQVRHISDRTRGSNVVPYVFSLNLLVMYDTKRNVFLASLQNLSIKSYFILAVEAREKISNEIYNLRHWDAFQGKMRSDYIFCIIFTIQLCTTHATFEKIHYFCEVYSTKNPVASVSRCSSTSGSRPRIVREVILGKEVYCPKIWNISKVISRWYLMF